MVSTAAKAVLAITGVAAVGGAGYYLLMHQPSVIQEVSAEGNPSITVQQVGPTSVKVIITPATASINTSLAQNERFEQLFVTTPSGKQYLLQSVPAGTGLAGGVTKGSYVSAAINLQGLPDFSYGLYKFQAENAGSLTNGMVDFGRSPVVQMNIAKV